jgi:hypothetical protein
MDRCIFSASLAELNCTQHSAAKRQLFPCITILHGRNRKNRFQQYLYCCLRIRCRRNVFTEPMPRSVHLFWLHYSGLQASFYNTVVSMLLARWHMSAFSRDVSLVGIATAVNKSSGAVFLNKCVLSWHKTC